MTARGATVLVVDDEVGVLQTFRRILETDHDVVAVETAEAAMNLIYAGGCFDLIVCDVDLPGKTAMAFYAWLREVAPEEVPRVVFTTPAAIASDSTAFLGDIENERLMKPVDPAAVRALAQRLSE